MSLSRSPLYERHVALGAKLADFSGWEMPIEYAGGGVIAEHTAVREGVGLFDVSHLGKATVQGAGAVDFLNAALSNDLRRIGPGQAQYTLCCDDASGGVVDDLIAYIRADDDVLLVPTRPTPPRWCADCGMPRRPAFRWRMRTSPTAYWPCRGRHPPRCWKSSACPPITTT